jgi:hypothetical protein
MEGSYAIQVNYKLRHDGRQLQKTGPNDTSGVVWAISKFLFFFFFQILLITTIV